MKSHVVRVLLMVIPLFPVSIGAIADEMTFETLEKQFRELPVEARRLTGPLFWLHGDESKELLEMYVGKVAEGGNGCFTTESRPHSDWLGEGWWRDLAICLEAAKQHGLKMWIFDEKWWPSGEVGGKVPPEYGCKRLVMKTVDVTGPAQLAEADWVSENHVATLAGLVTDAGIDGSSLADLTGAVVDGKLTWEAPAGNWRVMGFSWAPSRGRIVVDGASRDCVDWYLRTVYQPHYDRFPDDFGKDIAGFFFDEPETHGDWGTEVFPVLAERGADWKKALVAWKAGLAGEEQAAAKYQYQDALAEAWGRTMYGGISQWCREHGVVSIGHFLEHRDCYLNPDLCAGNMFQVMKYTDFGGIDAVFAQFAMGKRVAHDAPCWQTPKLGSSISHIYGKKDDIAMVEIFGARGQDLTYPEMKWWTDHMHVSGVSFLIPHSFNPRSPYDTDCPPYFYNNGFEPRWPLYRVFADYTSRLSVMLTGGRHVCPVALLFLGGSYHAGESVRPEFMSEALQDALYDCDWMPYEVLEMDATVDGNALRLREESYRILIVPPVEVIPAGALEKAKAFFDAGGIVVGYGFLPSKSATLGRTAQEIQALCEAVWGNAAQPGLGVCKTNDAGGRSYLLPEEPSPEDLHRVFAGDAGVHATLEVIEGETDHWLHVLHRVKLDRHLFFVTNQNVNDAPRRFRFRITAPGVPECWDAMRNEITTVPFTRDGDSVDLALSLEPNESVLLVFQPEARPLPPRLDPQSEPMATLAVVRDPTPELPEPELKDETGEAAVFEGLSWVWHPEAGDGLNVAPCVRCFRKVIAMPAGQKVTTALFRGAVDNSMTLIVNGAAAGDDAGRGWQAPLEIDVAAHLREGDNVLGLRAENGGEAPNPAGVLGVLLVGFEQGDPLIVPVDTTWKVAAEEPEGWLNTGFDDSAWADAIAVAPFGGGPWGRPGGAMLTLSPVKGDPFYGHVELPASVDRTASRVFLELDGVAPEAAARVTFNGAYVGGFIGRPLRLDVTAHLQAGQNAIVLEPFAPRNVRAAVYAGLVEQP